MLWSTAFLIDWLNGRVCHCAGKWGNELVSDRFAMLKKPQFYKKNTMKHVQLKAKVFPYFQILLKTLERLPILISLYYFYNSFSLLNVEPVGCFSFLPFGDFTNFSIFCPQECYGTRRQTGPIRRQILFQEWNTTVSEMLKWSSCS